MRKTTGFTILLLAFAVITFTGCGEEDTEQQQSEMLADAEGIHIEGAWARPGSEGRMSAAYFLITNFDDTDDLLIDARSGAAQLTEIHESYEREEGMMGMRQVHELNIPAGTTTAFEQGGLHIMLIQLTEALRDGESFELTLEFANHGEVIVDVPVRL